MSALASAALTVLVQQCVLPGVPPTPFRAIVAEHYEAIVRQESGGNVLALHDDATDMSYYPDSADKAEQKVYASMAKGHSVGVGLGQLTERSPVAFHAKFGITIRQALADPCSNVGAGSRLYVKGLSAALSMYNCGGPDCAPKYVRQVVSKMGEVRPPSSESIAAPKAQEKPRPVLQDLVVHRKE